MINYEIRLMKYLYKSYGAYPNIYITKNAYYYKAELSLEDYEARDALMELRLPEYKLYFEGIGDTKEEAKAELFKNTYNYFLEEGKILGDFYDINQEALLYQIMNDNIDPVEKYRRLKANSIIKVEEYYNKFEYDGKTSWSFIIYLANSKNGIEGDNKKKHSAYTSAVCKLIRKIKDEI